MRILIDTCIIIDALQNREPFNKNAQEIFLLAANRKFDGFITAKSVTDIYYLTKQQETFLAAYSNCLTLQIQQEQTANTHFHQRYPIMKMLL